jgi:hypothetical protein
MVSGYQGLLKTEERSQRCCFNAKLALGIQMRLFHRQFVREHGLDYGQEGQLDRHRQGLKKLSDLPIDRVTAEDEHGEDLASRQSAAYTHN